MIDSSKDCLDVRDIIARVETLRALREPGPVDLGSDEDNYAAQDDLFAELADLEKLLADLCDNGCDEEWEGDWYPVTLVRDSYFEDYARELAEDCGYLGKDIPSWIEIDWSATARNVRMDYSSCEFDGVTFWYR